MRLKAFTASSKRAWDRCRKSSVTGGSWPGEGVEDQESIEALRAFGYVD